MMRWIIDVFGPKGLCLNTYSKQQPLNFSSALKEILVLVRIDAKFVLVLRQFSPILYLYNTIYILYIFPYGLNV
jgi:hypothetical protein